MKRNEIMENISIAVLCGGSSSRFRFDPSKVEKDREWAKGGKLFYPIEGVPLYEINYRKFEPFSPDIFLQGMKVDDLKSYEDMVKNKGPLGGIYSALRNAESEHIFVVAADMPLVQPAILREFERYLDSSIVVPRWRSGYVEPLCSIYSKSVLPAVKKMLDYDILKVSEMYQDFEDDMTYIDIRSLIKSKKITEDCFININRGGDVKKIESSVLDSREQIEDEDRRSK